MFARTAGRCVTANHKFLFVYALKFDPGAASSARFVNGIALFADDSFEAATLHFLKQRRRVAADLAGKANRIAGIAANFLENVFPPFQRQRHQVLAVELEQIENVKVNWRFLSFHLAGLQKLK